MQSDHQQYLTHPEQQLVAQSTNSSSTATATATTVTTNNPTTVPPLYQILNKLAHVAKTGHNNELAQSLLAKARTYDNFDINNVAPGASGPMPLLSTAASYGHVS